MISTSSLGPIVRQQWRERAACADEDPRLFDPIEQSGRRTADEHQRITAAIAVCNRCPVIAACRAAITPGDEGIRAGQLLESAKAQAADRARGAA